MEGQGGNRGASRSTRKGISQPGGWTVKNIAKVCSTCRSLYIEIRFGEGYKKGRSMNKEKGDWRERTNRRRNEVGVLVVHMPGSMQLKFCYLITYGAIR